MNWIRPLVAVLCIQVCSAYLTRVIPTIAPAISQEFGWSDTLIGYIAAFTMFGSILFLLGGGPMIRRVGSVRALQIGLGIAGVGICLLLLPWWVAAAAASLVIGIGYGPAVPAGNDMLQRYAPKRHRTLIFSVKQAGVPLGGVIAGLALPVIVEAYGWRFSVLFSAILVVAAISVVQPLRDAIDVNRDPEQPVRLGTFLAISNLRRPLVVLRGQRGLTRVSSVGALLAAAQGVWFAFLVTYAVSHLGQSLSAAGALFAVMQATGVMGRMALGYLSDRLGSGQLTLAIVAVTACLTCITMVFADASWPFWSLALISGIAGITVSSWNGVQLAEIARLSPPSQVGDASAGSTVLIYGGFVLGPVAFAMLVGVTGSYPLGFLVTGFVTLAGLWPLAMIRRNAMAQAPDVSSIG